MFIPAIMIIMIFGTSLFTLAQEAPITNDETEERVGQESAQQAELTENADEETATAQETPAPKETSAESTKEEVPSEEPIKEEIKPEPTTQDFGPVEPAPEAEQTNQPAENLSVASTSDQTIAETPIIPQAPKLEEQETIIPEKEETIEESYPHSEIIEE